jgi:predicted component of type VI protein secretion system
MVPATSDNAPSQPSSGGPTGQTDRAAAGSGNTSSSFDPDAKANRLNVVGVPVEVPLQIADGPSRQVQPADTQQPDTLQVQVAPATISNQPGASTQLQAAPSERNSVPQDLRPIVRDYFTAGTPAQ